MKYSLYLRGYLVAGQVSFDPSSIHGAGAWAEYGGRKGDWDWHLVQGITISSSENKQNIFRMRTTCTYLALFLELLHFLLFVIFLGNATNLRDDHTFGK